MVDAVNIQYSCSFCNYKPISAKDFYKHADRHSFDNKFKLKCFYCDTLLSSSQAHRRHTANCKKSLDEDAVDENFELNCFWTCEHCKEIIKVKEEPNSKDYESVTKHLRKHVRREIISCPSPACTKSYNSYQQLVNHFNWHKACLN